METINAENYKHCAVCDTWHAGEHNLKNCIEMLKCAESIHKNEISKNQECRDILERICSFMGCTTRRLVEARIHQIANLFDYPEKSDRPLLDWIEHSLKNGASR